MRPTMIFQRLRRLLDVPEQLDRMENTMTQTLDALQAAVDRNGAQTRLAVAALADQREKIAALTALAAAGQIDEQKLAALAASIDASSDAVAQALAPVVNDAETDTGDAEPPAAQNPSTPDPADVEGAVPAGEPLPDELQA